MFGDWGGQARRTDRQGERQRQWPASLSHPVVIELGAGTSIPSVRHSSRHVVQRHGGGLVRINLVDCAVPADAGVGLAMGAAAGLTAIADALGTRFASTWNAASH